MEFVLKKRERFDRGRTDKRPRKKIPQRALKKLNKKIVFPREVILETAEPLLPLKVYSLLLRQGREGLFTLGIIFTDGTSVVLR